MSRRTTLAALMLYFASGAAALIYEVSWARQIGEVLGHSAPTAGVVLAAYFTGLAVGYEWGGRLALRMNPWWGYAAAEALAAVWAVAIIVVLQAASRPSVVAWLGSNLDPKRAALQAGLCGLLLLPATTALGATLPFMAELFHRLHRGQGWGPTILAYAVNTLGAVLGVIVASGVLLVEVGVRATSLVGAGLSIACAVAAIGLHRSAWGALPSTSVERSSIGAPRHEAVDTHAAAGSAGHSERGPAWPSTLTAAASGFVVLALEVLYFRLFSLVLHNSSYTFAVVLAVFLAALGVGAALAAWMLRWVSAGRLATASLGLGGVAVANSVYLFSRWTAFDYFTAGTSLVDYLSAVAWLAGAVMLPPVTLLGVTLPAVWREASATCGNTTTVVGRLSMVNTLSAAAGSLSASFWLLPRLGLWNSFAAVVGLAGVVAVVRLLTNRRRWAGIATALVTLLCAFWLLIGLPADELLLRDDHAQLLRRWESAYGWIDVVRDKRSGAFDIRQNLHYRYGSTGDDALREQRQAHLPLLLHPAPRDVLFLGLGTGVTAAGATRHAELERITVVELIPEVVEAARWLGAGNLEVLDDPRVRLEVDDARHFLSATTDKFDVVVGDLFVPWESETGYLYTQEHFQRIANRLRPGGVCCQWIALYQLGPNELRMIADTFASVFPETTLWWGHLSPRRPIVALVGTSRPLHWNAMAFSRRCQQLQSTGSLFDDQTSSPQRLIESLIGRWPANSNATLNTIEHPRVEFSAPWSQQGNHLLQQSNLRSYFLSVLDELPTPGGGNGLPLDIAELTRIRDLQRYVLFGE